MYGNDVTWFIRSNRRHASSRLQGYLIHEQLEKRGYKSSIMLAPPFTIQNLPWSNDHLLHLSEIIETPIVIFQKILDNRLGLLVSQLKKRGIKTIYVQCDYRPEIYGEIATISLECDYIVVTSPYLLDIFSKQHPNCVLIPDPIEYFISYQELDERYKAVHNNKKLHLIWVGNKLNWFTLDPLRVLLSSPRYQNYKLLTISDHPQADIQWNLKTVFKNILTGDIGVVPTDTSPSGMAKSHNRATLFMGLGLPVITGPAPSYEQIIQSGVTGFIAKTKEEWEYALESYQDLECRSNIAFNAYKTIVSEFTLDRIVERWINVFDMVRISEQNLIRENAPNLQFSKRQILKIEENLAYCKTAITRRSWRVFFSRFCHAIVRVPLAPKGIALVYKWGSSTTKHILRKFWVTSDKNTYYL